MLYVYALQLNDFKRNLYLDTNDRAIAGPLSRLKVFNDCDHALKYKHDLGVPYDYHTITINLCRDYTFKNKTLFYKGKVVCKCKNKKQACIEAWNHAKTNTLLLN